jgi:aspartate aminotransferase
MQGEHVVTINSFSKTFNMCGYRVGYIYSKDKSLIEGVCEIKTHTSMNTSIISQMMALEATKTDVNFVKNQVEIWKQRRNHISKGLKDLGLDHMTPEGAFYVLVKVDDPEKMLLDLFHKYKVITYLGEWFGAPGTIRLSYALDIEKIDEGLRRIKSYLSEKK